MKAVILTAGLGMRLRPLTERVPKCLLPIGGKPIIGWMVEGLLTVGIRELVVVTGYRESSIKEFLKATFPSLPVVFIRNERFSETNTGYSLMVSRPHLTGCDFIKLDGDVMFDPRILQRLIASPYKNCLALDRGISLGEEEIKAKLNGEGRVVALKKTINPAEAIGESIGIEKISKEAAAEIFDTLEQMMYVEQRLNDYYEDAYHRLVSNGVAFYPVDVTDLHCMEIDTPQDYRMAIQMFAPLQDSRENIATLPLFMRQPPAKPATTSLLPLFSLEEK